MVGYAALCLCMDTLLLHYSHIFFMQEPRLILYIPLPYFTNTVPFPASKLILLLILLLALLFTTTAAVWPSQAKEMGLCRAL